MALPCLADGALVGGTAFEGKKQKSKLWSIIF
jgi:hypothetical protein